MGSRELYERALRLFPGGVNSPVRAAVKPHPFYVSRAEGAYIYTVDGRRLVDLVLGYGPLILGHRHPRVLESVRASLEEGWLYGAPAEAEIELAEKILGHVKPGGMVRFVNSGTEATMTAIRLARGFTGRRYIVKFDGCYHGSHDYVLVAAGSAASEFGVPSSEGVPREAASLTIIARFNDIQSVEEAFRRHGGDIAAVVLEPVMANHGVIPASRDFISEVFRLAGETGSLVIFDEVVTGFRLGLRGASGYYGVDPDIVVLGKVIGGGFPVGAVVAGRELMESLAPAGRVFNAGTFNAHPVAMRAGIETIKVLEEGEAYSVAERAAESIERALVEAARDSGVEVAVNRVGSMLQAFFVNPPVNTVEDARRSRRELYAALHEELLSRGVFIAPSQFEAIFTGLPHRGEALERVLEAIGESFRALGRRVAGGG